jgi:hypothetical protein
MRRTVGRRAFLMGTAGVVGGASVAVPAVATSADEWHSVDFERLVESTFASLPDDSYGRALVSTGNYGQR